MRKSLPLVSVFALLIPSAANADPPAPDVVVIAHVIVDADAGTDKKEPPKSAPKLDPTPPVQPAPQVVYVYVEQPRRGCCLLGCLFGCGRDRGFDRGGGGCFGGFCR